MNASPSTVEASTSPHATPQPIVESSRRHEGPRQRATIACARCRRSKTKCDNNGPKSVCKSCLASGKVCEYPENTAPPPARRESNAGASNEGPPRKRKRNLAPTGSVIRGKEGGLGTPEDALDSPLLTPKVWKELFDIYEKHFATDFPFLHKRTFLSPLQQSATTSPTSVRSRQPVHYPLLLLAFLTQTSRYHPELVAQTEGPLQTAEFYADATRKHLGYDMTCDQSLEKIQALLMLGYHEWTGLLGQSGWLKIRIAISSTQAFGYQFDEEPDDRGDTSSRDGEELSSEQDHFIRQEARRRTFWSGFMLDRYLSVGRKRPLMLNIHDLGSIQLPCSDAAFNHGRVVRTRFFGENDVAYEKRRECARQSIGRGPKGRSGSSHSDQRRGGYPDDVRWEVGEHEEVLSRYIHVVDHFSDVMKWSNLGGRRSEGDVAPWNPATQFYKLEERLLQLKRSLPVDLHLTPRNTEVHIYTGTSRVYVLMHAFLMLSTVALYREYMAFSPWRVITPQGPLDEPKITEPLPKDRPDYWTEQARECFGAVKGFSGILQACQAQNLIVESPIAGFATYLVAWCALYCHYFPRMDPDHALYSKDRPSAWDLSNEIILGMSERFQIALQWLEDLAKLQRHWRGERIKYKEAGGSPESTTSDSGGGLKEYSAHFEKSHKEFGSLNNSNWSGRVIERSYTKLDHDQDSEGHARTAAASPEATFKQERADSQDDMPATPAAPASAAAPSNSFTPVNGQPRTESTSSSSFLPAANHAQNVSSMPLPPDTLYPYPFPPPAYTPSYFPASNGNNAGSTATNYSGMWQGQLPPIAGGQLTPTTLNTAQLDAMEQAGACGLTNSDMHIFQRGMGTDIQFFDSNGGVGQDWYGLLHMPPGFNID